MRRIVSITATTLVALSLAAVGVTTADAATAPQASCSSIKAAGSSTADIRKAVSRLSSCLAKLEKSAQAAGRTAEIADEHYLREKRAAAAADARYGRAQQAAAAAAAKAQKSRAQAGMVAADLARSGATDGAANLILDGGGATHVLYRVSRMSQLTVQSSQIFAAAKSDAKAADVASAAASAAAAAAEQDSATAKAALDTAKQEAKAAENVVRGQQAREHALQAKLIALQPGYGKVVLADIPANGSIADRVIAFARAQIGDPYVFAAAGPNAWDCSGLTMGAYASVGIGIGGHSATAQYDLAASTGRLVSYADRRPGDLLFYTDGGGDMYHVTIYSGNGNMIEAPQEGEDVREVPVRTYQLVGEVARFDG